MRSQKSHFVFVNDIGGQFLIRMGASDPGEPVAASQIWRPADNKKGEHLTFANEKGSHRAQIGLPPCSNGVAQTVPEASFPRPCRASPSAAACPTSAAARIAFPTPGAGCCF